MGVYAYSYANPKQTSLNGEVAGIHWNVQGNGSSDHRSYALQFKNVSHDQRGGTFRLIHQSLDSGTGLGQVLDTRDGAKLRRANSNVTK